MFLMAQSDIWYDDVFQFWYTSPLSGIKDGMENSNIHGSTYKGIYGGMFQLILCFKLAWY
jgi:hypothetical protein